MKHLYRKPFDHAFEAQATADGFEMMHGLNHSGPVNVSTSEHDGKHWVYVAFEGEFDPDELFEATGYRRVD